VSDVTRPSSGSSEQTLFGVITCVGCVLTNYVQFAVELQPARNRLCSVACGMTVNDA
jgi:hypothetical protein